MAAYNTPPGITVEEPPPSIGSPDVLVPNPGTSVSFSFTDPPGVTVDEGDCPDCPDVPGPPTTGQIWPRGNP